MRISRLNYLLLAAHAVAICSTVAAPPPVPLRSDGLYYRHEAGEFSDLTAYLRFYPDGRVLYVVCDSPPPKMAKWFYWGYVPKPGLDLAQGRYTLQGSRIRFSTRATREPRIDFSGEIHHKSLLLHTFSHYNSRRAKVRFEFIPVRLSR
jgi:hypothetical protein